jgi:hypothetical protein
MEHHADLAGGEVGEMNSGNASLNPVGIPAWALDLAKGCFRESNVLDAVVAALSGNAMDESKRFYFFIALSDLFAQSGDKNQAISFLQMSREYLGEVQGGEPLVSSRLLELGGGKSSRKPMATILCSKG